MFLCVISFVCSGVRSVTWIEPEVPDDAPLASNAGYLQLIDQRLLPGKLMLQKIRSMTETAKAIKAMVRLAVRPTLPPQPKYQAQI